MIMIKKYLPYIALGVVILISFSGNIFQYSGYKSKLKEEDKKQKRYQFVIDSANVEYGLLKKDYDVLDHHDDSLALFIKINQKIQEDARKYFKKQRDNVDTFTDDDRVNYWTNRN